MSSRHGSPIDLSNDDAREASSAPSTSTLPSAFGRMMAASSGISTPTAPETPTLLRDRCRRPVPIYNERYNPFQAPPADLDPEYSPYKNGEPLHDDRPILTARIPRRHVLANAPKRPRSKWVWELGYSLDDVSKAGNQGVWACKLCTSNQPAA